MCKQLSYPSHFWVSCSDTHTKKRKKETLFSCDVAWFNVNYTVMFICSSDLVSLEVWLCVKWSFWLGVMSGIWGIPRNNYGMVWIFKKNGFEVVIASKTHQFWPICKLHCGHCGYFFDFVIFSFIFLIFVQMIFWGGSTPPVYVPDCWWNLAGMNIWTRRIFKKRQSSV